jgi:hypothetical protein
MDHASQTMRVTVTEEISGRVIVEGSSADHDERNVHLDSVDLYSSKAYLVKYEFFEKNEGLGDLEQTPVSSGHMGASACSKPHVVAELVIASKKLIEERAREYSGERHNDRSQVEVYERDFTELPKVCDFGLLNNTSADLRHGESGLYCGRNSYKYDMVG